MWVPVCTPMARWDRLQACPRPISIDRCMTMGGLSGQCGMPCLTVTETSIHAASPGSVTAGPPSRILARPCLAPFPAPSGHVHAHQWAGLRRYRHPPSQWLVSPVTDELPRHMANRDQAAGDGVHHDRRAGGQLATQFAQKLRTRRYRARALDLDMQIRSLEGHVL